MSVPSHADDTQQHIEHLLVIMTVLRHPQGDSAALWSKHTTKQHCKTMPLNQQRHLFHLAQNNRQQWQDRTYVLSPEKLWPDVRIVVAVAVVTIIIFIIIIIINIILMQVLALPPNKIPLINHTTTSYILSRVWVVRSHSSAMFQVYLWARMTPAPHLHLRNAAQCTVMCLIENNTTFNTVHYYYSIWRLTHTHVRATSCTSVYFWYQIRYPQIK